MTIKMSDRLANLEEKKKNLSASFNSFVLIIEQVVQYRFSSRHVFVFKSVFSLS